MLICPEPDCDKHFFSLQKCLSHDRKSHTGVTEWQCQVCLKHVTDIKVHLKIHSEEKKFGCEKCPMRFRHKNSLARHVWQHETEKYNIFIIIFNWWNHRRDHPLSNRIDNSINFFQTWEMFSVRQRVCNQDKTGQLREETQETAGGLFCNYWRVWDKTCVDCIVWCLSCNI